MTVACSTVLAAGAAGGGVALWPGAATARQAGGLHPVGVSESGLGQSLTDFEGQHSRAQASASASAAARAARLAAERARAAARARAARRAAQLAAERQAASATAAPAPTTVSSPSPSPSPTPAPVVASGTPQQIAESLLGSYGWSSSQFSCLDDLWNAESGWNVTASNPSSGAYGIPQALPGSKMASAGPDWESDATTQIKWGLGYIKGLYGSPCAAWGHEESDGWY
jgi:hypothetical protein